MRQDARLVRFSRWPELRSRLSEKRVGTRNLMAFPMSPDEVGRMSARADVRRDPASVREMFDAVRGGMRAVDLGGSWALVGPRREVEDILDEIQASSILDT